MKTYLLTQLASVALGLYILVTTTGCAGSTGWRFEIGVSPVKQLDNRAGLTQETEKPVVKERAY
jgi:hypothetical protein